MINTINRFQLNIYSSLGLILVAIGANLFVYSMNKIDMNFNIWAISVLLMILGILLFSLNANFDKRTKVSIFIIGLGLLCKIMHWPLAGLFMLIGLIALIISGFFKYLYKKYSINKLMLFISLSLIGIGLNFKIFHVLYEYNEIIITIGVISLIITYYFRFSKKQNKSFEDFNKLILLFFWSISAVFTVNHLPYKEIFQVLTGLSFLVWIILSFIRDMRERKVVQKIQDKN